VTLSASVAIVAIAACGGSVGGSGGSVDAGTDAPCLGCEPPPACPATRPELGAACKRSFGFGPERCDFLDHCADRSVASRTDTLECDDVSWKLSSTDYVATCPKAEPTEGASCLCGVHSYGDCDYGDCSGAPTTTARCDKATGKWTVLRSTCNPPPPDAGGFEAGSGEAGSGEAGSSDAGSGGGETGSP
jgi:hypothetical protein